MKPERFITYLLFIPITTLIFVLLLSSWTIERVHLKK